ncbi:hypothetical protein ES708_29399 [subsurface metagenome]
MPTNSNGAKTLNTGIPRAFKAMISLSAERRPMDIREPTSEAKGKAIATIAGSEKRINSTTSPKGTRLENISSAISRS